MLQGFPINIGSQGAVGNIEGLTISKVSGTVLAVAAGYYGIRNGNTAVMAGFSGFSSCTLNTAWVAGNTQGKRVAASTFGNNATVFVFLLYNTLTQATDIAFDSSSTGANIATGTGSSAWISRRIGCWLTDGTGVLRDIIQTESLFLHNSAVFDVNVSNLGTTATNYTLTVPSGVSVLSMISANGQNNASNFDIWIRSSLLSAQTADYTQGRACIRGLAAQASASSPIQILTNTSAQINAVASVASTLLFVSTIGWTDISR